MDDHVRIDKTKREVFLHKIDLKKSKFHISSDSLFSVSLGFVAFIPVIWLAYYFEQFPMMWMAVYAAVFIFVWQLIFYGFTSTNKKKQKTLNVTNFYSKGTLIFLAIFWCALIIGVSIALYLKLPTP